MQHVLDVGGGRGDAFDARRRTSVGRVWSLDDGHPLIAGLFKLVDESQAVVAQQHGIGVERQHVFGVAHDEVRRLPFARVAQEYAIGCLLAFDAVPHQADEGIEVHGLVAFGGRRRVLLAFERPSFDGEDPYQPVVQLHDAFRFDLLLQHGRLVERLLRQSQVACQGEQHLVAEEIVGMVLDNPRVGLAFKPGGGVPIVLRALGDDAAAHVRLVGEFGAHASPRLLEAMRRLGQFTHDFRDESAASLQDRTVLVGFRMRRIVDEQHHRLIGEFLQRG